MATVINEAPKRGNQFASALGEGLSNLISSGSQAYMQQADQMAIQKAIEGLGPNPASKDLLNAVLGVKTYNPKAKQQAFENYLGKEELTNKIEQANLNRKQQAAQREIELQKLGIQKEIEQSRLEKARTGVETEKARLENTKEANKINRFKAESQASNNEEKIRLKRFEIEQKNIQLEKNREAGIYKTDKTLNLEERKEENKNKRESIKHDLEQAKLQQKSIEHAERMELENIKFNEQHGLNVNKEEQFNKLYELNKLKEENRKYEASLDRALKEAEMDLSSEKFYTTHELKEKEFERKNRIDELTNDLAERKFQQESLNNEEKRILDEMKFNQKGEHFNQLHELNKQKEENRKQEAAMSHELRRLQIQEARNKTIESRNSEQSRVQAIVNQLDLPDERKAELGGSLSLATAENLLKEQYKPKETIFDKKVQERTAEKYLDAVEDIPKLQNTISDIEYVRNLSNDITLAQRAGSLIGLSETASELEGVAFTLIQPIVKMFNPSGPIAEKKLKQIQDKYAIKATDPPMKAAGKLNALERFAKQALSRAEDRVKLFSSGESPKKIAEFDKETETLLDAMENYKISEEDQSSGRKPLSQFKKR